MPRDYCISVRETILSTMVYRHEIKMSPENFESLTNPVIFDLYKIRSQEQTVC